MQKYWNILQSYLAYAIRILAVNSFQTTRMLVIWKLEGTQAFVREIMQSRTILIRDEMFSFSNTVMYWRYYPRRQGLYKKSEMEMNTCSSNAMNWLSFSRRCSWRSWICLRCWALSASELSRSLLQEIRKIWV